MKKNIEEAILSYGDQIVHINNIVNQVRQTPDVYLGATGNSRYLTMCREIAQNSIDEIVKGVASSPIINIRMSEKDYFFEVEDNGRGIPHGKINIVYGVVHSSSNYEKKEGIYPSGKNGCGGSVTNMLSHKFTVDSYVLGKGIHVEFIEGVMWDKGEVKIPAKESAGKQGSRVSFIPNQQFTGPLTVKCSDVYNLIYFITQLAPVGTIVNLHLEDYTGKVTTSKINNTNGIYTLLHNMCNKPYINPIYATDDNGRMKCEVLITYDARADAGDEYVLSANNTCPTVGGTHADGALDGVCRFFRDYMNKIYLVNINAKLKNKISCTLQDIRKGLRIVVSSSLLVAEYTGQSKDVLTTAEIGPFISETVMRTLTEWVKTGEITKLTKYFKEMIDLRLKADNDRTKMVNKLTTNAITGYPDKCIPANMKKGFELLICEGDSAAGGAKIARDPNLQCIFPIKGKILNAFTTTMNKFISNVIFQDIYSIMGRPGMGKAFDISKCRVSKIIIMTDADPDGSHIRSLLVRMFAMYFPYMIINGMIFAATAPLYGLENRNGSFTYFMTKKDFVAYVLNSFEKKYKIEPYDAKKKYTRSKIIDIVCLNSGYASLVKSIAANVAVDPLLLEMICINIDLPKNKLGKELKSRFRFIEVDMYRGVLRVHGAANETIQTVFITPTFIQQISPIIKILKQSEYLYRINGEIRTLFELMSLYDSYSPKVQRFKGLGEMDAYMLGESTLDVEKRTLIQYSSENVISDLEYMRERDNDKNMIMAENELL